MPLTLSGRRVDGVTNEHPTLTDIAIGLSRMPRFAGQTHQWFSVLDHTMFGFAIMTDTKAGGPAYGPVAQQAWLLHDAHEAITSDVPTDVKGDDLRRVQDALDRRIYGAFFPAWRQDNDHLRIIIKEVDKRCLRAEAEVLKGAEIGGYADRDDVALLRALLGNATLGLPPRRADQGRHPLVRQYIRRMLELM